MRIEPTGIDGLVTLRGEVTHDSRGSFTRAFCRAELAAAGIDFEIDQVNLSHNIARHTLRGLHFQRAPHGQAKIVSCTRGRIFDVAVDLRPHSPTWREWRGVELAPDSGCAVHLPAGMAHGFLTLEPDSEVHYLMAGPYVAEAADGVRWDDPAIAIAWPAAPAMLSARDAGLALLDAAAPGGRAQAGARA